MQATYIAQAPPQVACEEFDMVLAKVVGTVVSTQKESSMTALRFLLVEPVDPKGAPAGNPVVAVDAVGAGPDEYVLYATGSSARQTAVTDQRPCDAVIMAIVDQWEIGGRTMYHKGDDASSRKE